MAEPTTRSAEVFAANAQIYDDWFDQPKGQALFEKERQCLAQLKTGLDGKWLEVGVGGGRFAHALGVTHGIDPAQPLLELARARGIQTTCGMGENLPYPDESFDGVLMVCTICFVRDASEVLKQCARVLKPGGHLLIGFVPADSAWGAHYRAKAQAGHTFWACARFFTQDQLVALGQEAGLVLVKEAPCDLALPPAANGQAPADPSALQAGAPAGFSGLLFQRPEL